MKLMLCVLLPLLFAAGAVPGAENLLAGFAASPWFGEQTREERTADGIRMLINAPGVLDPALPTRLVIYATPNGNTLEQTLGCAPAPGLDWHFDIQHVAAQIRRLREVDRRENIVLARVEAEGLSWPTWNRKHPGGGKRLRGLVTETMRRLRGNPVRITLSGHSGGGSFLFAVLSSGERIPEEVERIAFLDANYSYSELAGHGDRLLAWLHGSPRRHLSVIAYDDRQIMLNGKLVVGAEGGTYRASQRMLERLRKEGAVTESASGTTLEYAAQNGQVRVRIVTNPENRILHTALVGERNGLLAALTEGTPEEAAWGKFGPPRAYTRWIQPAAFAPVVGDQAIARPANADAGAEVFRRVAQLGALEREALLRGELLRGNLPPFLWKWSRVTLRGVDAEGREHMAELEVMPDFLAVGSDEDFVRVPLTPATAQAIADQFQCLLPTRKIVDAVYAQAAVKLEPVPLTEARETAAAFLLHNTRIEEQRRGKELGLLTARTKKDVVVTNRLDEKPGRVAIYGWHQPTGVPIQPLTTVHAAAYVDYSHGIRLVRQRVLVDGKPMKLDDLLRDPALCVLVSDEGPIVHPRYQAYPVK